MKNRHAAVRGAPVNRTWIAALVLAAGFGPVRAQSEPPLDDVGLLYSTQVQFDQTGIPLVTIGLMDQQSEVELSAAAGLEISGLIPDKDQAERKTIRTGPGEKWRISILRSTPARVGFWVAVKQVPLADKATLRNVAETWRKRAEQIQVFEIGSVFGIQGHVIDNRAYIVGLRSYPEENQAVLQAQQVFKQFGEKTFVHPNLERRPTGSLQVHEPGGLPVEAFSELIQVRPIKPGKSPITVHRVEHGKGYAWHGFADRQYADTILVTFDRHGKLTVINRVRVDRLLNGLVPAEIPPAAPMESLKAQAVVARGEVFAKIGTRHFLDPYLLCAETHCQVYSGVNVENARTSRAVQATRGELLFLGQDLVDTVYSASCGGHSEDNDAVWSDPPSPALRGRADTGSHERMNLADENQLRKWLNSNPHAFCHTSSFNKEGLFRWTRNIESREMDDLVAQVKPVGHVVSVQVLQRGVSGRATVVRVIGTEGELVLQREWPIRKMFGGLKSAMFLVEPILDPNQLVTGFRFRGGGWGHGVGLCQIGSIGMAERGFNYRQILAHYYGGAQVFRLFGGQRPPPMPRQPEVQPEPDLDESGWFKPKAKKRS